MLRLAARLRDLLARKEPAALVTLIEAKGSTPREAGACMLVTARGLHGTIGGGRMEWDALQAARSMLAAGGAAEVMELPLGPELGQCCGGFVRVRIAPADVTSLAELDEREAAERAELPLVMLFGAGHVGRALAPALAPLPFRVRWLDGRPGQFEEIAAEGVEIVLTERPLSEIAAAPPGAFYVVMSHSHALDFEICAAVLQRGDFAYLGLIGSRSKRMSFLKGFRELGVPEAAIARLVCPIGGTLKDKRPPVIAALVAAELITRQVELAAGGREAAA